MGCRLHLILHLHPAKATASHFGFRLEWGIAQAALFFLRQVMERVDLVVGSPPAMEKARDSRQPSIADFSAARFWPATGPVYFPASDFLLSLADSVPVTAALVAVDSAVAGPVSVAGSAVKTAVDLACFVAAALVCLACPPCLASRFFADCFVAEVVDFASSSTPRSFTLRNRNCPSLLCFAGQA